MRGRQAASHETSPPAITPRWWPRRCDVSNGRCGQSVPMPRRSLAKASQVDRWREGAFEEAVKEGIAQGKLRELPLDWIESAER